MMPWPDMKNFMALRAIFTVPQSRQNLQIGAGIHVDLDYLTVPSGKNKVKKKY